MVLAAVAAWAAASVLHTNTYLGALIGVAVALVAALVTYFAVVQPIQKSRRIPNEEKEIFVLTGTLLWGIMIQELIAYFFTNNAKTVLPIVEGVVDLVGVRTPRNEIFTALVCCLVIGLLWLLVNRTRTGKAVLAASMNPRRRHAARAGIDQHLCRGLGHLRHPRRHRRRAARHVPRRQLLQRRTAHRERVLDRGAGRPRQRVRLADRRLRGRLSRNPHGPIWSRPRTGPFRRSCCWSS